MSESEKIKADIEKDGSNWVFIKRTAKASEKDWRPKPNTEKEFQVKAIEVLVTNANLYFSKNEMPEEVKGLILPAYDFELSLEDGFKKDGKTYNIKKISKIRPANETLLYRVMVYL